MPVDPELQRRIKEATDQIGIAERELETAITQLKVSPRGSETMISQVLQDAFEKLAAAKRKLEAIVNERA